MHVMIAGQTLSGKSTLAKARARYFKAQGIGVIVIDPTQDPEWNADYQTRDQEAFLKVYWASRQCMAFFDEGSKSVGRYNFATEETATLGRHRGHVNHYIVQRAVQIPVTVRDQCTELFLFCSSKNDGKILADEWCFDELAECHQLKKGEYFHVIKMQKCERRSLFKGEKKDDSTNGSSRRRYSDNRNGNSGRETEGESKRDSSAISGNSGSESASDASAE